MKEHIFSFFACIMEFDVGVAAQRRYSEHGAFRQRRLASGWDVYTPSTIGVCVVGHGSEWAAIHVAAIMQVRPRDVRSGFRHDIE